jgi:hypothetical protein
MWLAGYVDQLFDLTPKLMNLKVALVATNSLLSSQLIVGIISVLHEARKPTP